MQVKQRITVTEQHLGDGFVNQLVAHLLGLGHSHEAALALGVMGQVFELDLGNELSEVLVLIEGLLDLLLLKQQELDGDGRGLVGVRVVCEADRDVHCEHVVCLLQLFHHARAQEAVSPQHLHLEQTVEAVLSTRGVERELGIRCRFEALARRVVYANVGELLFEHG